jgi:hypothetical protein
MPCLELKFASFAPSQPASRLRTLLEKPNTVILRRNYPVASMAEADPALVAGLSIRAVLAVDITNPPEDSHQTGGAPKFEDNFVKGIEFWFQPQAGNPTFIYVDFPEIAGALAFFDAYDRLSNVQPLHQRLDRRLIGLSYSFREGLTLSILGSPRSATDDGKLSLAATSPISEIDDPRLPSPAVRLPHLAIFYLHELFNSADEWLKENSYQNILGS